MRQRPRHPLPKHAGRGPSAVVAPLAVAVSLLLGACTVTIPNPLGGSAPTNLPVDESGPWLNVPPTQKELLLAKSDFSVEIVRFTDDRRPRSTEEGDHDQTIYKYDPDNLIGGVTYQAPNLLGKYLSYRPKMPKNYKVEIDLKRFVTQIKTGTFWSGSFGRYSVDMELTATVRRPDSTVVLVKNYRYDNESRRTDTNGYGPSKERDRTHMFDLVESTFRNAAQDIGWDIRQSDARTWKAPSPQSIPTQLNRPPVDRATGTTGADAKPAVNAILPTGSPIIVPSAPADAPENGPSDMWIENPQPEGTPAPELAPNPTNTAPANAPDGPDETDGSDEGVVI